MIAKLVLCPLACASLSTIALAQTVSSATFSIGGAVVPPTAVAANSSVDIIDWDPISNDVLEVGLMNFVTKDADGNWVTKDVNTKLFCDDGEVKGNNDGSGENPANVFVRVVFRDAANNVVKIVETTTKDVKCV